MQAALWYARAASQQILHNIRSSSQTAIQTRNLISVSLHYQKVLDAAHYQPDKRASSSTTTDSTVSEYITPHLYQNSGGISVIYMSYVIKYRHSACKIISFEQIVTTYCGTIEFSI